MNKVVRLKDDTIHILQSDKDTINLIEEYMGRDISKLIEEIKEELRKISVSIVTIAMQLNE